MQIVPSLPPPISAGGPEEGGEINKLAEVKKIKDALEKPVSTPLIKQHAQYDRPGDLTDTSEKRHAENDLPERRIVCRRIRHQPILTELRSEADRRKRKQRKNDLPEHINEEA